MPLWPCPTCGIGQLQIQRPFIHELSSKSKKDEDYLRTYPEDEVSHYVVILICNNSNCRESVSSCGLRGNIKTIGDYGFYDGHTTSSITPIFFYPSLQIITLSNNWPINIRRQIEKSFSHFFNDGSACANSIRTSIEMLMDELKINKTTTNKNKQRKPLKLHDRIVIFGKQHSEINPYIMAAKWIGNTGSHSDTSLNREKLLDGYDFLEHCLYELYDKKPKLKDLSKKANVINKRKKP